MKNTARSGNYLRSQPVRAAIVCLFIVLLIAVGLVSSAVNLADTTEVSQTLWADSQSCDFEIKHEKNSVDGAKKEFDGETADCEFKVDPDHPADAAWTYTGFEPTELNSIQSVGMDISFYLTDWPGSPVVLQASLNNGADWDTLERYDAQQPAPGGLTLRSYVLGGSNLLPETVNGIQVRFLVPAEQQTGNFTIHLDAARLNVSGIVQLSFTPTPSETATEIPQDTPTETPTEILLETPTETPTQPALVNPTETPAETSPETPTQPVEQTPTAGGGENPTDTMTPTLEGMPTITATPTGFVPSITDTPTPEAGATLQGTLTPETTTTSTATLDGTPLFTETPTSTPTLAITMPQEPLNESPAPADTQRLWGIEQSCSYPITSPENGIDLLFNGLYAACTGAFAQDQAEWRFTGLQPTTFTHADQVVLELRIAVAGWVDDLLSLEVFDGAGWQRIAQYENGQNLPSDAPNVLTYDVSGILSSPEAINQADVRIVGVSPVEQADTITIFLDEIRLNVVGGQAVTIQAGPIPTPMGRMATLNLLEISADPHADFSSLSDGCAGCHRSHTASGNVLRQIWPEEGVCFACHASGGSGTNVQPAFTNYSNTATRIFTHNVFQTSGVHQLGQSAGSDFGNLMRHIECEDCHDPHNAGRGAASAPMLPQEMNGVSGVDPVWTSPGVPSSYAWVDQATREYQVCFKCHSSFTSLPTYIPDGWNGSAYVANGLHKLTNTAALQMPDWRDLAREFNPYQNSFHPVAAQGRNQNIPAGSFVSGWSQTSLVYCSDCHVNANAASEGSGPHGSPRLHLLGGGANFSTVYAPGSARAASSEICFQCHNYQTYVTGQNESTNFQLHDVHMNNNWGTTCYTCHDSHGSEQMHLINFDASAMTFLNGRNSQSAWYYDPASGKAGCFLSCHGEPHNPREYTP